MTAGGTEAILSMAIPAMKMGLNAAQQSNDQAAREADARSRIKQIQQAQNLDERRRREQLKQALAARRARFGALGISSSGSAEAVLAGLAMEAERQDAEERSIANTRINRINDQSKYSKRKSLLDFVWFSISNGLQPFSKSAIANISYQLPRLIGDYYTIKSENREK